MNDHLYILIGTHRGTDITEAVKIWNHRRPSEEDYFASLNTDCVNHRDVRLVHLQRKVGSEEYYIAD